MHDRFAAVLARIGSEPTATETLRLAVSEHASLATLIHDYATIAAYAVSIGNARWSQHDGQRRTRIAGLITIPAGNPPADDAAAVREREAAILDAVRHAVAAATEAREPWTHRTPTRALEVAMIYRAKYAIIGPDATGAPSTSGDRVQARGSRLVREAAFVTPPPSFQRTAAPAPFLGRTR